jgi:hypothetical protein
MESRTALTHLSLLCLLLRAMHLNPRLPSLPPERGQHKQRFVLPRTAALRKAPVLEWQAEQHKE